MRRMSHVLYSEFFQRMTIMLQVSNRLWSFCSICLVLCVTLYVMFELRPSLKVEHIELLIELSIKMNASIRLDRR